MADTTLETAGVSFELSDEAQSVREMVRDFAESEIRPSPRRSTKATSSRPPT